MGATATLQKLAARRDLNLLAYNHIMFECLELLCNSASAIMLLASEQCERDVIRGNKWKLEIYFHIYVVRARHFSSTGLVVHNVGGVKCQPLSKA